MPPPQPLPISLQPPPPPPPVEGEEHVKLIVQEEPPVIDKVEVLEGEVVLEFETEQPEPETEIEGVPEEQVNLACIVPLLTLIFADTELAVVALATWFPPTVNIAEPTFELTEFNVTFAVEPSLPLAVREHVQPLLLEQPVPTAFVEV